MPAGNWRMYGAALEAVVRGALDIDSGSYRMVLLTSAYTPDQAAHAAWSSLSAAEVANGNGYATHGQATALTVSRSGLEVTVDCSEETWTNATITAKYAVIVHDADSNGALASSDVPLCYVDLDTGGGSISSTNAPFTIDTGEAIVLTALQS